MRLIFVIIACISIVFFQLLTTLTVLESLSVGLFISFLLKFLDDLGKKISILDIPILLACLTWLVLPVIFYHNYTKQLYMARLWDVYMPVESDDFFAFVLPATIAMWIGLKIKFKKTEYDAFPQKYIYNAKQALIGRNRLGIILISIGIISGFLMLLVPSGLSQVFYFGKQLSYVGMFYIYFSDSAIKRTTLISLFFVVLLQSVASGMFGELIYLLLISFIIIMLEIKIRFWVKLTACIFGLFFLLVIQNLKSEYRMVAWKKGSDPVLFTQLAVRNITHPSSMFKASKLFGTAVRLNQGWLIARTMYFVPKKFPFANGETIGATVVSIIIPRIFYPEKREVGGAYNLKRFWGFKLRGYSMDIGAIGEGYGNFGILGGIIFMFFYGFFFNVVLGTLLKKAQKTPTFLCWLPFLFINSVQVETDMLNTINSLFKGLVFMWFIYWSFKTFFGIRL